MTAKSTEGELRVWLPVRLLDAVDQVGRELAQGRPETVELLLRSGLRSYEEGKDPARSGPEGAGELGPAPATRWE